MITIEIHSSVSNHQDMVYLLIEIAKRIENGNTSGIDPTYQLSGEEEVDEAVSICIENKLHLTECDDDGFCNHCGHQ